MSQPSVSQMRSTPTSPQTWHSSSSFTSSEYSSEDSAASPSDSSWDSDSDSDADSDGPSGLAFPGRTREDRRVPTAGSLRIFAPAGARAVPAPALCASSRGPVPGPASPVTFPSHSRTSLRQVQFRERSPSPFISGVRSYV